MTEIKIDLSGLKQFADKVQSQLNGQSNGPVAIALKQWGFRYRSFAQERFDIFSRGGGDWPALALSTIKKRRKGPNAVAVEIDETPTKKKTTTKERKKKKVGLWKRIKKGVKAVGKKVSKKLIKRRKGINTKRRKGKPNRFVANRLSLARVGTKDKYKLVSAGGVYSILRDTGLLFQALDPIFNNQPGSFQLQIENGIEVGFGGPSKQTGSKFATIADIATYHQLGNARLPQRKIIVDPPQDVIDQMTEDMQRGIDKLLKQ